MLLRHGDSFGIMYATHVPSEGFQRFSVGHELGHFFLDGHVDHILPNGGIHASHAGFTSMDPYELEADHFSAGLLMPSKLFLKELRQCGQGLEAVESMAMMCRTSLTATAIRYAELTDDAVAVVMSTNNTITYCFISDTMKTLPEISWPRKGAVLPSSTVTARFNQEPGRIAAADRSEAEVDISDWFGGNRSVEAMEEIVGLGQYGRTLTVLTCPTLVDETYQEEDEDEDAYLEESWTPRFRR